MVNQVRKPAQSDHSLKVYIECSLINFTANEGAEDKHAAVFLSELSERAYTILRNPVAPDLPRDKIFTKIITSLESHYDPKPIMIALHFTFIDMTCSQWNVY